MQIYCCLWGFFSIMVMVLSTTTQIQHNVMFDMDSASVGIDNRWSTCISDQVFDFVGELQDSSRVIKGLGGTWPAEIKVGTLKWSWLNDHGKITTHVIPNLYYVPQWAVHLLSSHHLAKTKGNLKGHREQNDWNRLQAVLGVGIPITESFYFVLLFII